jgi:hypothetical protein
MRTVLVKIKVKVPSDVPTEKVLALVDQMLTIGYDDAARTADDPDLDHPDAEIAQQLSIGRAFI